MHRSIRHIAIALTRALSLAAIIVTATARAQQPTVATLYENVTLIDGTGSPPQAGQDILVRGERIVATGPHGRIGEQDMTGVQRVDLSGRYVIPGLIDTHVHLATPPDRARAEAVLRRNLYGGVTAVRDMADDDRSVAELARAARVGEIAAPDIYFAALMAGPPFFQDARVRAVSAGVELGTAPWMQSIDDRTDMATAVTLARGTSATAIKIYADLPPRLVAAITREAHRQHIMVWSHSAVFPTRPADVIAAGPDSVSHVCYLAYQLEPVMLAAYEDRTPVHENLLAPGDDPTIAALYRDMLRRHVILDATGSLFVRESALRRAHPERRPLRCSGDATIRLTRQAWHAGVPISTGTDYVSGPAEPWPDVHNEITYLVHDVGMSPLEAIRSATLVGAQAAGQAADMGTIAAGKLANFVVLTADPLADIGNIRSIDTVVKRGRAYARSDFRPLTREEMGGDDAN